MTNLTRWEPFGDLRTSMDRFFDAGFSRRWRVVARSNAYEGIFPIEVSETDDAIEFTASLPGVRPEEVEITVSNDVLTVKAEHKQETEAKKRDFYRREIRYGSLYRSLSLPVSVDADKAEAVFDNGLLRLKLPKTESLRPKQIKVSAGPTTIEGKASEGKAGEGETT